MDLEKLVRPNIWSLQPYSSARHEFEGEAEVFLDANENPFDTGLNRYPDPLQLELKARISALKNVPTTQMFLGNGSDEGIDLLMRIFCEPGRDAILTLPPTYGMYRVSADIADVAVREVSLTKAFQPDVEAVLNTADEYSKMLFLCSPNNPTGNLMKVELVEDLLLRFPGIVVVDEAYIDFAQSKSWSERLAEFPNLVVLQTFSKAWGLAGIRLGMAFANPAIIDLFNKVKPPYNVNSLTQEAALDAMAEDGRTSAWIETILNQRTIVQHWLMGLEYVKRIYPSQANFLLVEMDAPKAVYQYLVKQGIVVRDRSNVHLCEGCLRITIGTPEENERLFQAMIQYQPQPESNP